jgi:hypothetical protein
MGAAPALLPAAPRSRESVREGWKRRTFRRILRGLSAVSFAAVKSDVIDLIPRDDNRGLTADEIGHPVVELSGAVEAQQVLVAVVDLFHRHGRALATD